MIRPIDIACACARYVAVSAIVASLCGRAHAASVDGIWKLESSSEYFGDKSQIDPLPRSYIEILNGKLLISDRCTVKLTPEKYSLSTVFQMLLRQGVSGDQLTAYLRKRFSFDLSHLRKIYEVEENSCTKYMQGVLIDGDKMLIVAGNTVFYSLQHLADSAKVSSVSVGTDQVVSRLPFSAVRFVTECAPLMPLARGVPQSTRRCLPLFMPYVTSKTDKSLIGQLVGHHRYLNGDARHFESYNDPVTNGLHPVYMVLPSLGNVTLVRVQDQEANGEDRDSFAGAYLSIKDGAVADQLNDGCSFIADFICVDDRGVKIAQLLSSGKFSKF